MFALQMILQLETGSIWKETCIDNDISSCVGIVLFVMALKYSSVVFGFDSCLHFGSGPS